MNKVLYIIGCVLIVCILLVILTGCAAKEENTVKLRTVEKADDTFKYEEAANAQMSMPEEGETVAIIKVKGFGEMKFKFFPNIAPKAVENFTGLEIKNEADYENALKDLKSQFQQKADAMIEQQTEALSGAAGVLTAAKWDGGQNIKASSDAIKDILDKMTAAQVNSMNITAEAMGDSINNTVASSYANTVATLVKNNKSDVADKFQDAFDGVDFSSGIATLEAFNKALEISDESVTQFGKSWTETGAKSNATAKALQEVFSADDFKELEEDLAETSKEMGGFDASAILTAAESSSTLDRYLKATGASAEGVARAFELISNGSISINSLTPSVVAAANAMEQLSASAGRANKFIESFEIN